MTYALPFVKLRSPSVLLERLLPAKRFDPTQKPIPHQKSADEVCLAVCLIEKPKCPVGEAPIGSEGCWGCCQPIPEKDEKDICTTVCRPEKPECPAGEAPTGQEGCWGCCEPVA
ncbi:hypothetical protein BDV12DRAFT_194507 [Aspergillus spectabilis]